MKLLHGKMKCCRWLTFDTLQFFTNIINDLMIENSLKECFICSPHWLNFDNPLPMITLIVRPKRNYLWSSSTVHKIMLKNLQGTRQFFYSVHFWNQQLIFCTEKITMKMHSLSHLRGGKYHVGDTLNVGLWATVLRNQGLCERGGTIMHHLLSPPHLFSIVLCLKVFKCLKGYLTNWSSKLSTQ